MTGSLPIELNLAVSPPNEHMLVVTAIDDEGFSAEDETEYFIASNTLVCISIIHCIGPSLSLIQTDSTNMTFNVVSAQVPPLQVSLINDSPRVVNNTVEVDILISRPVQRLVCRLKGVPEKDCEHVLIHARTFLSRHLAQNLVYHCSSFSL